MNHRARHLLRVCVVCAGLIALGGCNIIAPGMYLLHGRGQIDAVVELDPLRPTVIFIDDRASVLPRRSLRIAIGQEADSTLLEKNVIKQGSLISSTSALRFAADERYGEPRPVSDVALSVGAEIVIYAECIGWSLSRDGLSSSPVALLNIKVLDARNARHVWPPDGSSMPLRVELPRSASPLPTTRVERQALEQALAITIGKKLARLFYKHERDRLDG